MFLSDALIEVLGLRSLVDKLGYFADETSSSHLD